MSDEFGKYTPEEAQDEAAQIKKELTDKFIVSEDSYPPEDYDDARKIVDLKKNLTEDQLKEYEKIKRELRFGFKGVDFNELENSDLPKELIGLAAASHFDRVIRSVGNIRSKEIEAGLAMGVLTEEQVKHAITSGSVAFIRDHGSSVVYSRLVEEATPWVDLMTVPEYRAAAVDVIIRDITPGYSSYIHVGDLKKYLIPLGIVDEAIASPRVQEAAAKAYQIALDDSISRGTVATYMVGRQQELSREDSIKEFFNLTDEQLQDVQIQEVVKWLNHGNDPWAYDCIARTHLTHETLLGSEAFIEASRQFLARVLKEHKREQSDPKSVYDAIEFVEDFKFNPEFLADEEIQEAAKESFLRHIALGGGDVGTAQHVADTFILPQSFLTSPEAKQAASEGIEKTIKSKNKDDVEYYQRAIDLTQLSAEAFLPVIKSTVINIISESSVDKAREFTKGLGISEEEFLGIVQDCLVESLDEGILRIVLKIADDMDFSEEFYQNEEIHSRATENFYKGIERGSLVSDLLQLVEKFHLPNDIGSYEENVFFNIREKMHFDTIVELLNFAGNYRDYTRFLANEKKDWIFNLEELNEIEKRRFEPYEAHLLKERGFDLFADWEETNKSGVNGWKQAFEILSEEKKGREWKDEENIVGPLKRGSEIFGYKRMFDYVTHSNVGRHDTLYAFDSVIMNLYEPSGLEENDFYSRILQQALDDTSTQYQERSSIRWLNNIAQNTSREQIQATLQDMAAFAGIPKLRELSEHINSSEDVFSSWSNLKRFYEIQKLLGKRELLEKLAELKDQGKDQLYNYIETLAFHETSDVSIEKVMQFWQEPERFLGVGDEHSGRQHNMKKPSNYVNIPNLDLTAEDLRDSLIEGKLDSLQVFHPFEITYDIPLETEDSETLSTRDLLKKALGSRRNSIPGQAKDPGKLFSEVGKIFKPQGINLQSYLAGEIDATPEQESAILQLVSDSEFGIKRDPAKIERYKAKIYLKSDPEGVVAGNDTACCMPFGSGKNNVYTFNPVCSIFTVQRQTTEGKWRTIAQSVLTEDRDIKTNINDLMQRVEEAETPEIAQLIPDEVLKSAKSTITADNVEVAPNFKAKPGAGELLEQIYRDFFKEYLSRYNSDGRFDDEQLIIGEGYSDALQQLPRVNNTFLPQAPVAYSDNVYPTSYMLDLQDPKTLEAVEKTVAEIQQPPNETESAEALKSIRINGLSYLDFRSTLPVAFLEGKAYADNPSLLTYLHNLENGLIAKDISNSLKGRPNMSLKWQDTEGKIHGYILAYEGKRKNDEDYEDRWDEDEDSKQPIIGTNNGERVLYISDLASDKEFRLAGGNLIKGFVELYRKNYVEKGDPVPIFFEGREQTSYAIMMRQIERISRDLGVEFEIDEGDSYLEGGDTMHPITLRVRSSA